MAHYKISFRIGGKTYYTEGESTYPSDEEIINNNYSMDIAKDSAFIFASAYKDSFHIVGNIEKDSLDFEIHQQQGDLE